jgi:hypothetical protein
VFFHFGVGLKLQGTYQAIVSANLFKSIGASSPGANQWDIVLESSPAGPTPVECTGTTIINNAHETPDAASVRTPARIHEAGDVIRRTAKHAVGHIRDFAVADHTAL